MDWSSILISQLPNAILLLVLVGCLVAVLKLTTGGPRTFAAVGFSFGIVSVVTTFIGYLVAYGLHDQTGSFDQFGLVLNITSGTATVILLIGFVLLALALIIGHRAHAAVAAAATTVGADES